MLSGNSLRQTVHTHFASVHPAAKLVAALLRVAGVTAGLAESNGSLPPGLWFTSHAGWLPRTGISSRTLRSVIEYGLPLLFYCVACGLSANRSQIKTSTDKCIVWSMEDVQITLQLQPLQPTNICLRSRVPEFMYEIWKRKSSDAIWLVRLHWTLSRMMKYYQTECRANPNVSPSGHSVYRISSVDKPLDKPPKYIFCVILWL